MRVVDCVQGTAEWWDARLGKPTASQFDRILTPKTRKPSSAMKKYRAQLLADWLMGQYVKEWEGNQWTERGIDLEGEARNYYAMMMDVRVEKVGFVLRDDGLVGGSPDGLVGVDGGLEIKCLEPVGHVELLLDEDPGYIGQVQGYMYLTDRSWWDILAYNPDLLPKIIRIDRDEEYIKALVPVLDEFVGQLEADKERLAEYRVLRPWSQEIQAELEASCAV